MINDGKLQLGKDEKISDALSGSMLCFDCKLQQRLTSNLTYLIHVRKQERDISHA